MSKSKSACHKCKHFEVQADAGYYYSEYTWSGGCCYIDCEKGHFNLDVHSEDITSESLSKALSKGDNCNDFEEIVYE